MASIASTSSSTVGFASPKNTTQRPKPESAVKHQISPVLSLFSGGIAGAVEAAVTVSNFQRILQKTSIFRPINRSISKVPIRICQDQSSASPNQQQKPICGSPSSFHSRWTSSNLHGMLNTDNRTYPAFFLPLLVCRCSTVLIFLQGTTFKAGVRFLSFDSIRNRLMDKDGRLTPGRGILAGMVAGCVESIVAVTPTERVKTAL